MNIKILDVNIGCTTEQKSLVHYMKVAQENVQRKEDLFVHQSVYVFKLFRGIYMFENKSQFEVNDILIAK